jgi:hypothetical protein
MSEKKKSKKAESKVAKSPQTQKQRWVRYGTNVGVAVVAVVFLAVLLTYGAQNLARDRGLRADTTKQRVHSLKQQSLNIIKELNQNIRMVALYERTGDTPGAGREQDFRQTVSDLLDEYARKSKKITVDVIDPQKEPSKVDQVLEEIIGKYGSEVKAYQQVLDEYPKVAEQIKKAAAEEKSARCRSVPGSTQRRSDSSPLTLVE